MVKSFRVCASAEANVPADSTLRSGNGFREERRQTLTRSHYTLPHDLNYHVSGPYQTSITSAFPEEGKALETRLRTAVEQIMGKSRTDALWTRLVGSFHEFNAFGAWPRALVLHFDKEGSILLTHPIEGSQAIALDEVPEQFKPFVEEWKSAHDTDRKNIP